MDKREGAVFMCVSVPVAWGLWYVALLKTHSKCPPHPTAIRRRLLHLCAMGAGVALFVMVFLAVEGAA